MKETIAGFVYMLIAQTGITEQDGLQETVITTFHRKKEVQPLTRLIAFFFGDKMEDTEPSPN